MAHARYMLDKEGYTGENIRLRPYTHTSTHSTHANARIHTRARTQKFVTFDAFSWQQWFFERALILHNTYIACLV
jgi:hypothetical protein